MKLLHEIVQEEIQRFYPALPKIENGVASINFREISEDMWRRKEDFIKRLTEDRALHTLCLVIINQIVSASVISGIRTQDRQDAYTQSLVEAITIWERANEKFNEQLGMPPQLPAPIS